MPILDMCLEELKQYQGSTPRPADFDAYWERALQELDKTDPAVKLQPAAFASPVADCYDMYFTGVGGAQIYAKLLVPKNIQGTTSAMLHFHGFGCASSEWVYYLPYAASGMVVAAMDCRGQGGKSEDVGGVIGSTRMGHITRGLLDDADKLLYRQIFLDTAQLARIVMAMPEVDETRVGASGGSQGGALTLACAALEPRIRLAMPRYPYLCDYKRVWDMDLDVAAYEDIRDFFRWSDPRHEREEEFFTKLGYIDLQNLAPRIKAEVIMATGLMDNICPPSTQFAAFNKMTCPKKNVIYPDFAHEDLRGWLDIVYQKMMTL